MSFLLDTQVFLWLQAAPEKISSERLRQLADAQTILWLSAASAWEIAIKHALGKLRLPSAPSSYVPRRMRDSRIGELPVSAAHALRAGELPRHHRDPFDRLLVAQAQLERLPLITADAQLRPYDVRIVKP